MIARLGRCCAPPLALLRGAFGIKRLPGVVQWLQVAQPTLAVKVAQQAIIRNCGRQGWQGLWRQMRACFTQSSGGTVVGNFGQLGRTRFAELFQPLCKYLLV